MGKNEFVHGLFGRFTGVGATAPAFPSVPGASDALRIDRVIKSFAGLTAVDDVSFTVEQGRVTGLIGPNGAGKSTLVNAMTCLYPLTSGQIAIGERRIDALAPHEVAKAGISRTFQNIRLFSGLTVGENVAVAALANGAGLGDAKAIARRELEFVGLDDMADRPADGLAYGARRRLEIARALATRPRYLLLDEPAAGMNPDETSDLASRLKGLPDARGLGLMLIDHDLKFVMSMCDRVVVLNRGRLLADDTPERVQRDPSVIEAYTGTRASRVPLHKNTEANGSDTTEELSR